LLTRSWIALTTVLGAVLGVLAVLSVLQHDAVLSQLIRQRLSVTVEATAAPFRSMVELGMPVSMVRNAKALLERARETDPQITAIHLFNPSGIVVTSTVENAPQQVAREILAAQREESETRWTLETAAELVSGVSIRDEDGTIVGGVVAFYPKRELMERSARVARDIAVTAFALLAVFSTLAFLLLRLRLSGALRGLARLRMTFRPAPQHPGPLGGEKERLGFLHSEFQQLDKLLSEATAKHSEAVSLLPVGQSAPLQGQGVVMVSIPESSLARSFGRGLTPLVAGLILASALALGLSGYFHIERSFTPEFEKRTNLIGTVAQAAITRTVQAGVPLEQIVGGSEFFRNLLDDFPEIAYFAVVTDRPLLEVGKRAGGAPSTYPIRIAGDERGRIVTEADAAYLATQFKNVVLDLGVVLLATILFALELIILTMSGSLTGPFDRLLHLLRLQAAGDFSRTLKSGARNVLETIGMELSERANRLSGLLAYASARLDRTSLIVFSERFRVRPDGPEVMRFCSLSDVRLALFLFTAADQLPLSFFSLYVRAADNPLTALSLGLVISLPLSAYLLAALLGSAAARPLAQRIGHRAQFLAAAGLAVLSNIGLFVAGNVLEIILYSALNGLGFALASLACQDYVIDRLPKEERSRKLGLISAALFAGVLAGTALGGVIADRIGQRPVFLVCAALVLVSAGLIVRLVPRHRPAPAPEAGENSDVSLNFLAPFRNLRFAALAFGLVVPQIIADQVFISYLLALAMDELGSSVADIGRLMMVYFVALIAASTLYDKIPRRYAQPSGLAILSGLIGGAALIMAALHPSPWSFLLATAGAGIGHGLSRGPQNALTIELAEGPLSELGSNVVFGAIRVLERGGSVLGLLAIGILTSAIGYSGATGAIAAILLGGAGVLAAALLAQTSRLAVHGGKI
jgi:MFS family permease